MNLPVIAFPNVFGTTVYHLIFLILDTFAILSNPDIRMYLRSTATDWHSLAISYAHLRSTGARLAESPSFDIAFRTHPDESQFSARRERKRVVQDGRTPPSAHGTTKRDEIVRRERKATNLIKTEPAIPSSNAEETAPRHTGPRASIGCAKSPMRQPHIISLSSREESISTRKPAYATQPDDPIYAHESWRRSWRARHDAVHPTNPVG